MVLLEAERVGWGASGRNGGQVGSGQRRDQGWLEAEFGEGRARALWDMAEEAKALVRALVSRHGIGCELKPGVIHAVGTVGICLIGSFPAKRRMRPLAVVETQILAD